MVWGWARLGEAPPAGREPRPPAPPNSKSCDEREQKGRGQILPTTPASQAEQLSRARRKFRSLPRNRRAGEGACHKNGIPIIKPAQTRAAFARIIAPHVAIGE